MSTLSLLIASLCLIVSLSVKRGHGPRYTTSSPHDDNDDDDRCSTEHRHRKPWHELSQQERDLYITGFKKLNEIGKQTVFTLSHADDYALHQAHASAAFGPWHRYFLWEIESAIRDLGGDYKCFSMPYWDFSYETTQSHNPHDWVILNSGLGGSGDPTDNYCVREESVFGKGNYVPTLCWPGTEPECCLVRVSCSSEDEGCCTMYSPAEMMDMIISYDVYGEDSNLSPNPPDFEVYGFKNLLEMRHGLNHDVIGGWVDETRTSLGHIANLSYSPDDPIFFLLHSYVDYNWALWQDCHDYDQVSNNEITLDIYGGTLGEPDGEIQIWGPSRIDDELSFEPLRNTDWSYLVKENWILTPRDMHNIEHWDVSYEKGSFFESGKAEKNCPGDINPNWFYDENDNKAINANKNKEFSDDVYDLLDEQLGDDMGKSKKEIVKKWAEMDCEWHKASQKDECSNCSPPKYFDDCSDLPIDPKTGDIDVTLSELLEKVSGSECMENTRRKHWNWAVQMHNLLGLCRGDFDHFCNTDFIRDGKPNKCKEEKNNNNNNSNNDNLPLCDSSISNMPCIMDNVDDFIRNSGGQKI